jgi:integrase
MPTTAIRFTQETVRALEFVKPGEKPVQREYTDTESDLWLKVGRKAKTFFVRSVKTGLEEAVGRFDKGMTVKQARDDSRLVLARLDKGDRKQNVTAGVAPTAERVTGTTLKTALEEYLNSPGKKGSRKITRKPSTVSDYRDVLNRHTPAGWWNKPLASLTAQQVDAQHTEIGEKAGHVTADKWLRYLRAVYNGADSAHPQENLPRNPVKAVAQYKSPARTEVVKWNDLPDWWKATGELDAIHRDCWRFLLCSGLRSNAGSQLKWSEVDFENSVIIIPAERMKGGEEFSFPMSKFLKGLLERRKAENPHDLNPDAPISDDGYVFPEIKRDGSIGPIVNLRDQRDDREGILACPQTVRRTFNTVATDLGIPEEHRSILCDHRMPSGSVNKRHYYGRMGDNPHRLSLEKITNAILEGVGEAYDAPIPAAQPTDREKQLAAENERLRVEARENRERLERIEQLLLGRQGSKGAA